MSRESTSVEFTSATRVMSMAGSSAADVIATPGTPTQSSKTPSMTGPSRRIDDGPRRGRSSRRTLRIGIT